MTVLRPMSEFTFAAYIANAIPAYASDKAASGQWSEIESLEMSRNSFEALLPQGLATPDHFLYQILDSVNQQVVGILWMAAQDRGGHRVAYVYDVIIEAPHRRKGHATRAFYALEDEARRLGLTGIALHVFGHRTGPQALYAQLGYRCTNINLFKPLGPPNA